MLRHYDEIIPYFFDHLENVFLEGWVYAEAFGSFYEILGEEALFLEKDCMSWF
jgi:hypothetical protein